MPPGRAWQPHPGLLLKTSCPGPRGSVNSHRHRVRTISHREYSTGSPPSPAALILPNSDASLLQKQRGVFLKHTSDHTTPLLKTLQQCSRLLQMAEKALRTHMRTRVYAHARKHAQSAPAAPATCQLLGNAFCLLLPRDLCTYCLPPRTVLTPPRPGKCLLALQASTYMPYSREYFPFRLYGKCLFSTFYVPGTVPAAGNTTQARQTKSLPS